MYGQGCAGKDVPEATTMVTAGIAYLPGFLVDGPPPEGGGSCNGLEALFRLKPAEGYPHQAGFNK